MNPPQAAAKPSGNQELSRLIGQRARDLFASGQMLCTAAVLSALNQGLGGGLDPELVLRLAGGLYQGLGGAGCLCGAVSGGNLALGLFLGNGKKNGRGARRLAAAAQELHDQFKAGQGSTCCRVLTKKVKHDHKLHTAQCAGLSGLAAELAARLILAQRPELAQAANLDYLWQKETKANGLQRVLVALGS
ncbi:MAG: C_GCAxxG_C_C family protein [Desulfarculus sp.]|nr:MAG: C_GCAxxG_C_C family protein [Desulfarculus sp.]